MTVFNLGSINIDLFYQVPHFPSAGETMTTLGHSRMLGGKGANQSIALARAGMPVIHIGACNSEDRWLHDEMQAAGVDVTHIQDSPHASGHAIVSVDPDGENQILLAPSANRQIDMDRACAVLDNAVAGDWALLQNETNGADSFVAAAREKGLKLAYSAAPFDASVVLDLLPHTDLLVVNEGEAVALGGALGALASSGAPSGSAIVALLARVCEVMCSLLRTSTFLCPISRDLGCHEPADPRALQVLHSDDTTQPRNAYPSALTLSPRWVEARTRCAGVRVSLPSRAGLLSGPASLTCCRCAPTPRSLSKVLETLVAVQLRSGQYTEYFSMCSFSSSLASF